MSDPYRMHDYPHRHLDERSAVHLLGNAVVPTVARELVDAVRRAA